MPYIVCDKCGKSIDLTFHKKGSIFCSSCRNTIEKDISKPQTYKPSFEDGKLIIKRKHLDIYSIPLVIPFGFLGIITILMSNSDWILLPMALPMIYFVLAKILNITEILADDEEITVKTYPLPIPFMNSKKKFRTDDVSGVYVTKGYVSRSGTYYYLTLIANHTDKVIDRLSNAEDAEGVRILISKFLNIRKDEIITTGKNTDRLDHNAVLSQEETGGNISSERQAEPQVYH